MPGNLKGKRFLHTLLHRLRDIGVVTIEILFDGKRAAEAANRCGEDSEQLQRELDKLAFGDRNIRKG